MQLKKESRLKAPECYLLIAGIAELGSISLGTINGVGIPTSPCRLSDISNKYETQTTGSSDCIRTSYGQYHYQLRGVLDVLSSFFDVQRVIKLVTCQYLQED